MKGYTVWVYYTQIDLFCVPLKKGMLKQCIKIGPLTIALQNTVDGKNLVQEFYAKFSNEYSDHASEIVNYLLMAGKEEFDNVAYKDSLWKLAENYYKKEMDSLKPQMETSDLAKRREVIVKYMAIQEKIKNKKVEI